MSDVQLEIQLFNHIRPDGRLAIPPARTLDLATRLEVATLIGEADSAMHCCRDAARAVSALYSEIEEFYSSADYYDDSTEILTHEAVLDSAEYQRLEVLIARAADACYVLAMCMDHALLPATIRHGAATIGVFQQDWVAQASGQVGSFADPDCCNVLRHCAEVYRAWVTDDLPALAAAGHFPLSHLKRQWRAVDRRVVHALGKGRTLAELRRLDAACYGQQRLGRSEAMAVPFIELVAMCDGHPQHSVPPEAALFIASNNNSKRLRTR